jgi:hypothetical protein
MKKRRHTMKMKAFLLAMVLGSPVIGLAYSPDDSVSSATVAAPQVLMVPVVHPVVGLVESVDVTRGIMQVRDNRGSVQTMTINTSSQIQRDGKLVPIGELEHGDHVSVTNY